MDLPQCSVTLGQKVRLDCELRPGKQHCQNNTPQFIQKIVKQLEKLKKPHPYLFRLDSGNDSLDNLKILLENKHFFTYQKKFTKGNTPVLA